MDDDYYDHFEWADYSGWQPSIGRPTMITKRPTVEPKNSTPCDDTNKPTQTQRETNIKTCLECGSEKIYKEKGKSTGLCGVCFINAEAKNCLRCDKIIYYGNYCAPCLERTLIIYCTRCGIKTRKGPMCLRCYRGT